MFILFNINIFLLQNNLRFFLSILYKLFVDTIIIGLKRNVFCVSNFLFSRDYLNYDFDRM